MSTPCAYACSRCGAVFAVALTHYVDNLPACAKCYGRPWAKEREAEVGERLPDGGIYLGRLDAAPEIWGQRAEDGLVYWMIRLDTP